MTNARILRDLKARHGVNTNEIARRAYLYVARNQTLPPQVRYQAQLQLNTFGRYTRPTTVKNRCTESGRGRGILSEFGLSRVRGIVSQVIRMGLKESAVSIPTEGVERRASGCKKGVVVDISGMHLRLLRRIPVRLTLNSLERLWCCTKSTELHK